MTADIIASKSDNCVVLLQWSPPGDGQDSVSHYVIDSPSGSFTTRDATIVPITLFVHNCDPTTCIRIHAVDYCDCDGPSTNDTLGQLLPAGDSTTKLITTDQPRSITDHNIKCFDSSSKQSKCTFYVIRCISLCKYTLA